MRARKNRFYKDNQIKIHFFDMDNTLVNNDCDVSWKSFAVAEGLADQSDLQIADDFFEDYNNGVLDFEKFMKFQLKEFTGNTPEKMEELCRLHFEKIIKPTIYYDAYNYINELKNNGCQVYILTSTNTTIAKSVANFFKVDELFGTELEIDEQGLFTGNISGVYAAQAGKVAKVKEFCEKNSVTFNDIAYYGDSINDKNILEVVGEAYAVNPSAELLEIANLNGWEVLSFN